MHRPIQTLNRYGLTVETVEQDKLSSRLVKVVHQGPELADMSALKAKAEHVLTQIRYLEDELRTVEQDEARQAVVLRSVSPEQDQDSLSYYEVLLQHSGETQLTRKCYQRSTGETTAVDFTLTDRLLERLGKDLDTVSAR